MLGLFSFLKQKSQQEELRSMDAAFGSLLICWCYRLVIGWNYHPTWLPSFIWLPDFGLNCVKIPILANSNANDLEPSQKDEPPKLCILPKG